MMMAKAAAAAFRTVAPAYRWRRRLPEEAAGGAGAAAVDSDREGEHIIITEGGEEIVQTRGRVTLPLLLRLPANPDGNAIDRA